MNVPFFDLELQTTELRGEIMDRLEQVSFSGRYTLGPEVESFERHFAEYCETRHCIAVNSGTSALHLALAAQGVGPGDEVITTPMTFVATAWAISYVGAKPVFVDIDPRTWNLDPTQLSDAITPRTKAIIPVHLYGRPAEMDVIKDIAAEHGLRIVEDAAQAHGARFHGQRVGSFGDAGCFSFYPSKNLGALGEGGAIVTDDEELADAARALRDHGQFHKKGQHDEVGFNYRMIALQGSILNLKLSHLDAWNQQRRQLANQYLANLDGIADLELPAVERDVESVYHLFVVLVNNRQAAIDELQTAGIGTGIHYPIPVHLQPAYEHLGRTSGSFPVAERVAQQCLSLPMFPELTSPQVQYVCEQIQRIFEKRHAGQQAVTAGG